MDRRNAEDLLEALGKALEESGAEPVDILVCGSMALILQGLIDRRTRDIDGIGIVIERGGNLEIRKPLLDRDLSQAIERVGTVFGFQKHWLSFQARVLIENGLPEGIIERATVKRYGDRLTVRLSSPRDMVYFKIIGAINGRIIDEEDLVEMEKTEEQVGAAAAECLADGYEREKIADILRAIGYGKLAEKLGR